MENLDFLEGGAKSSTVLDEVMQYVEALQRLDGQVENAENVLSELKEQRRHLAEDIIPSVLEAQGLDELKLSNGKRVSWKQDIQVRIPTTDPLKKLEALDWLRSHDGEYLVKRQAVVEDPTPEQLDKLSQMGVGYTPKEEVNTNSLQAFFREAIGLKKNSIARIEPTEVPSVFGLYMKRTTKIG